MMKYSYCTLFDINYLPHALSLCESLDKYIDSYIIYCFCMDDESYSYLNSLNRKAIKPISHLQLEAHYPELQIAQSNRSRIEYYFTCTSAVCSYVFNCFPKTEMTTYLDADLYFFSSPEPIYQELNNSSIGIIEHRFSFFGKRYQKYGKYNVGWVSFRNDQSARKCLEDWRKNCLEWCYDRLENGQFADQKYLDYWPDKYTGVHIIQHLGANLAPWNIGRYRLKIEPVSKQILVNNSSLIFYHFASFKQVDKTRYITNCSLYLVFLTKKIKNNIYLPYLKSIKRYNNEFGVKFIKKNRIEYTSGSYNQRLKDLSRKVRLIICCDYIEN